MTAPASTEKRAHALLSASSAHRWLHCTAAPRLEATFPYEESDYAREGTLAHSVAEISLRCVLGQIDQATLTQGMRSLKEDPMFTADMVRYVEQYTDFVQSTILAFPDPPYTVVEQRLDFSHLVPNGFGTGDCVVIGGDVLHIIDFKYGQGVEVDAEDNPQMMLYALGAMQRYATLFEIHTVRMTIFQPRRDHVSTHEMPADKLLEWGENTVKPTAWRAYTGNGTFDPGEWCRFCRARHCCRARAEHNLALSGMAQKGNPDTLTNDEIARVLDEASNLADWVKDLQAYVLAQLCKGEKLPGWKLVEKSTNRAFTDQVAAFEAVKNAGYDEALLYERKPLTLAGVEKLIGKKTFATVCAPYVFKPKGEPILARASDKRPEMILKLDAKDIFKPASESTPVTE